MCILLIAYREHPDYPLIIAANRDENYSRPTIPAYWWPDNPGMLAGRDLRAGGTWLGVTRAGRFAAITNLWDDRPVPEAAPSRGTLVQDFLMSEESGETFLERLRPNGWRYDGFNLVFGTAKELFYYNNSSGSADKMSAEHGKGAAALYDRGLLTPGIYAVSNARLDTPWPKVVTAKNRFSDILRQNPIDSAELFELLGQTVEAERQLDPSLSRTERRELSRHSIRVCFAEFGTRSSTVVLFHRDTTISFRELNFNPPGRKFYKWKTE